MTLNFANATDDPNYRGGLVAHEGQHGVDEGGAFKGFSFIIGYGLSSDKRVQWETQGYRTESGYYRGAGVDDTFNSAPLWKKSWAVLDKSTIESK